MAISALWSRKREEPVSSTEVSLEEVLNKYDLIHVSDEPGQQFAIVTEKGQPLPGELGTSSPSPWTSDLRREYNPKLQGLHGLSQYDKMRKSDGTVRGTLRVVKTPVLAADWFIESGGTRRKDKKAAEFVYENLWELMSISMSQVLTESLLMCDFGNYMFEKVWEQRVVNGQLRTILKKLAPRHPMDVEEWITDANGGPVGVWMRATPEDAEQWRRENGIVDSSSPYPGMTNIPTPTVSGIPNLLNVGEHPHSIFIPIEKLVVFTFDREAGNIEGISVLRSAYKHWYFKEQLYKIDAIQKERHGIGIPIIKLPIGYKDDDKKAAEELGRNIRTNERAHIVLPPGWDLFMLKLEGNPVNAMESIKHHDSLIEKNIVAYFLNADTSATNADVLVDMFLKSVRFIADIVADTLNRYCIPQLAGYNFPGAQAPKLKYRHIGEAVDWRTQSFAIRNFIGAGVIRPDDELEKNIREQLGLPKADTETTREVATPQGGPRTGAPGLPRVGPPRQAPIGRQRNTQGLPRGNAGQDQGGS